MKVNTLLLSTAIASACFMSTAMAADGVINFEGKLVANTCDITIDGQASPATVTLPTVSVNTLANVGDTTGRTSFNIGLSNCQGVTSTTTAAAFYEAGATVDSTTFQLVNTAAAADAATNVQLQLLDGSDASYSKINIGNQDQNTKTAQVALNNGAATLPYAVQYYATDAATPGQVSSQVNFSINYQ
ncbi:fimbrial protein [Klebsiella oxytoca]|uniref:fimbrial protein n=1 Tax=Klebsiella oxytoca TaxID=571 RepID=UPI00093A6249|nr:fimbrial protein [Klebsiella oxytoca]EIX9036621.1 type 1 fimbrial protein [Klebsiella oxytoca]EIX9045606.1 type 1 fimbrial protein [Klebsiella oxytoca]EIZ1084158.1 type 1 fimbrial protein [Klebsiella oxytoca]EKK0460562.1 type 1 fimbrial protein [Klebsiella oxytoca]EKY0605607.1 type 1 fimbrial protein [Klebsiella oxytoca]